MTTVLLFAAALGVAAAIAVIACLFWDETRSPRLECLMYHRFVTPAEYRQLRGADRIYSVSTRQFEEQLRYLKDRGYHCVTMADAVAFAAGRRELPQPAVLITIDDGSRCALDRAQPVLARLGMRGTLFVTTDPKAEVFHANEPAHARLSDLELREINPDVIEIAAHGVSHRPLTSLSNGELAGELRGSREELERVLGRPVHYLAAPGGWYDDRVRRFAEAAGFEGVWTSEVGTVRPGHDPLALRRVLVSGTYGSTAFAELLTPRGIVERRLLKTMQHIPQRLLGPRVWTPIGKALRSVLPARSSLALLIGLGVMVSASAGAAFWLRRAG